MKFILFLTLLAVLKDVNFKALMCTARFCLCVSMSFICVLKAALLEDEILSPQTRLASGSVLACVHLAHSREKCPLSTIKYFISTQRHNTTVNMSLLLKMMTSLCGQNSKCDTLLALTMVSPLYLTAVSCSGR